MVARRSGIRLDRLYGDTEGLKAHHDKALRGLYNRRTDRSRFVSVPLARAQQTFMTFMSLLSGVFLLLLVLLNIMLHFVVIRPVKKMSMIASEVSLGKADVPEYIKAGSDEISSLSQSFHRMRLSLESALKMLGE